MERTRKTGIKLSDKKCVIKRRCQAQPKQSQSHRKSRTRQRQEGASHFLGMATYMSSFIPNIADHTAPFRKSPKGER